MEYLEGLSRLLFLTLIILVILPSHVQSRATDQKSIQIIKSMEDEPIPMTYQFITDQHNPTTLGGNYYIKPGQLVGTFSLDSGLLNVRHDNDDKKPIRKPLESDGTLTIIYRHCKPARTKVTGYWTSYKMVILTIPMIESRGKGLDYLQIVQLNLWGTELHDVSVFLEMPRLEILSLSLNKLVKLDGLKNCHKLQELYLRKNLVDDVEELVHLKNASNLQIFTLLENPVATILGDTYRPSVLRMLPQIKNLDGLDVRPSELRSAMQKDAPYLPPPRIEPKVATPEPIISKRATAIARREEWNREVELQRLHEMELDRKRNGSRDSPPAISKVIPMDFLSCIEEQGRRPVSDDCYTNCEPQMSESTKPDSSSDFRQSSNSGRQPTLSGNPTEVPRGSQNNNYDLYDLSPTFFSDSKRHDELELMHYRATTNAPPCTCTRSMVTNSNANYCRVNNSGPLRSNANLLSSLRNLIRELDPASLVLLSQAIHEQMQEMPPSD